ncbi:MAG: IS3 family transposase [Actinobacteria bacterium]|nr:IS3 family transposase [Actinomycetota bacterium]
MAYIDRYRGRFGVEPICSVLSEHGMKIAPSTYYAHAARPVSPAGLEEAYLVNALVTLWEDNWGVYGARKLWHAARRAGLEVGRDQVARLMKVAGITGAVRGRHRTRTTVRDPGAPRHPDLVKRGWNVPTGVDQLWVADIKCRRRHLKSYADARTMPTGLEMSSSWCVVRVGVVHTEKAK